MALIDFISRDDQQRISNAIAEAESRTSGEICVHVTTKCKGDAMEAATKKFNKLGLFKTERRNAVLIYIAYKSKKFAIIGDEGIDKVVPDDYWHGEKDMLAKYLSEGKPADGICSVVARIGDRLVKYFPAEKDDVNELSNEVSFDEKGDD